MSNQLTNIREILSAINDVKSRATAARQAGDLVEYSALMSSLLALEQCLVYQAEALVKEAA